MELEQENEALRKRIKELEDQVSILKAKADAQKPTNEEIFTTSFPNFGTKNEPLNADQIKRYGRHLIMSEIGVTGLLSEN